MRGVGAASVAAGLCALACSGETAPPATLVVVELGGLAPEKLLVTPAERVRSRQAREGTVTLEVTSDPGGSELRVEHAAACPHPLSPSQLQASAVVVRLRPRLSPMADLTDVGFGARFTLEARSACDAEDLPELEWRQTRGAPLGDVRVTAEGRRFEGRLAERSTPDPHHGGADVAWGLVPLSPATRGEVALEVRAAGTVLATVGVAAASRSRGLDNVPVGARSHLAGEGWRLERAPEGSTAALVRSGDLHALAPDLDGEYVLRDEGDRRLELRAERYDATPLDCGRAGCHVAESRGAAEGPMTTVLARLGGVVPAPYPGCALACHATGEPGASDGGFAHVAREIHGEAWVSALAGTWPALPRALRRLGGVGCLACHGPGAIPTASARWATLRSDVCATCHDAPPRYGHVAAWRTSRMARADADATARTDGECVACHTTRGFLAGDAVSARAAPEHAGPLGIACAACHAVHDDERGVHVAPGSRDPLLRRVAVPREVEAAVGQPALAASRVCLPCHAPGDGGAPRASAAALWSATGGVRADGEPLTGRAVHGAVDRGCVGCHSEGPRHLERGAGHAFAATERGCASCHDAATVARTRSEGDALRARADALLAVVAPRLRGTGRAPSRPPHAAAPRLDLATPAGRAAWNLLLVLEDRGAFHHNLPYARTLVEEAERASPAEKRR